MLTAREEFRQTLLDYRIVTECALALHGQDAPIHRRYRASQDAAWKRFYRTPGGNKARLPKDRGRIHDELADLLPAATWRVYSEAQVLHEALSRRLKALRARLSELALAVEVRPGTQEMVLEETWDSTFRSQGWGATRYAEKAAERHADLARHHGVEVEIRRRGKPLEGFQVVIRVRDWTDLEALRRLPGPELREQVRLCWKRGVNPRVYFPMLDMGYEGRVGLDYFGGEKAGKRVESG